MGGRLAVRRVLATALPIAALVLTLVLLPSLGSGSVPTAVLTGSAPAATVVHLLGDEVAPASPAPGPELRRAVADGSGNLVAILLAAATAIALAAGVHRERVPVTAPSVMRTTDAVGRAPPRFHRP